MLKDYPYIRQVRSPLIKDQLRPLDPRCQTVQFSSLLSKRDFASLAQFLQQYPAVELRVYGSYDESITNLKFLEYFPFVKRFAVDVWQLESFEGIECLPSSLQSLQIGNTKSKRHSLKLLRHFPELKELYIEGHIKDIKTVGELIRLEDLTLRSITIPNLSILTPLNQLKSLDIKLGGTKNLDLLPRIGKLQYIELWRIRGLKDLSPVADVETLQFLFLQDLSQVTNFPSLNVTFVQSESKLLYFAKNCTFTTEP